MEILVVGLSVSGFLLASGVPMDNADITRFHFMEKDGGLQENRQLNSSGRQLDGGLVDETRFHPGIGDNYVYPASLMDLEGPEVVPDPENFGSFHVPSKVYGNNRPEFWTKGQHRPPKGYPTMPGSHYYIQKLDSLTRRVHPVYPSVNSVLPTTPLGGLRAANANRYEEVELTLSPAPERPKSPMSGLMKKFLASLLVEQYGRRPIKPINPKTAEQEQELKFLYGDTLGMLKNKTLAKLKQLFGIFTVVKFNSSECNTTNWAGTWQGTCLTAAECTRTSGTALGGCARGFGVCCVFRATCGDSSSTNCTYFKSPNYPDYYPSNGGVVTPTTTAVPAFSPTPDPRLHWYHRLVVSRTLDKGRQSTSDSTSCVFTITKANTNVQQLRIDFVDLDLAGPTNGTCVDERLVISGQNANDPIPVICGYNTGQHVYVDVSQLSGPLAVMVLSATGAQKRFKLRICQYSDTCQTSRGNCLQYYTGTRGVIQSFNYDRAAMFSRSTPGYFNNLNYAVCIRREAGYCSVTYSSQNYPFQLVNSLPNGQSTVPSGQAGVDVLNCPDDFIIIDGTRLCGDRFNDGSTVMNFSQNAPVVDTSSGPIVINVRSNGNVTGLGFKLSYTQNRCPAN